MGRQKRRDCYDRKGLDRLAGPDMRLEATWGTRRSGPGLSCRVRICENAWDFPGRMSIGCLAGVPDFTAGSDSESRVTAHLRLQIYRWTNNRN